MNNPSLEQFGNHMIELLPQLMQEISRYENNYVTEGKITCHQFLVLEVLSHKEEWQMNELVTKMQISFSTATGMIDRLLKHGLVKRHRGESDRRTVLVAVTAKGKRIINEVYAQKKEGIVNLFGRLTKEDRTLYLDILNKLVMKLSSVKGETL